MKIVCWNLKNLGQTKLGNPLTNTFTPYGLGNTVLDYMMKVVMGSAAWNNLWASPGLSASPADIFVIIELKTGGHNKNQAVSGTCIPTLTTVVNAMNLAANNLNVQNNYQYSYATPLITGNHETVGVIYNNRIFNANPATIALRDNNNLYINPRTPFMATLVNTLTNDEIKVVGIHAPPVSGGANTRYRPPIDYIRRLGQVNALDNSQQMIDADYFVMGDYNCNPASTYINGFGAAITGFAQLLAWNYNSRIPNGTLSSVRTKVANTNPQPANYLSEAYDNMLFDFNATAPVNINGYVLDLIGNARNVSLPVAAPLYPNNVVAVLNNYNKVSDHLPMIMEF
jgi:hypothetical protein